eukprot:TRINITY_DN19421_c0_g1_i1.p1 TRINITY_DN19421_c0_g1~~TRINITY_DN19421_c0_g1_i1.p1  ORF type:complete len:126 (+),score=21.70 TRINITY_DN19421_c0_g1_i1:8-385(+)
MTVRPPDIVMTPTGFTALYHASEKGYEEVVACLLAKGANVHNIARMFVVLMSPRAVDVDEMTPLHAASCCGHVKIMGMLLDKGASVNAVTMYGMSVWRCLMDHRPDPLAQSIARRLRGSRQAAAC